MIESTSNLFSYLGKPVKDEYGHMIGTLASFLVTPGGRINAVFIDHGDGYIDRHSSDQIEAKDEELVLFSPLKMKVNNYCNQIPLLWRKTQAIKDLNEKQKIPESMYDDLYSSFEGALDQLKAEAESAISDIEKEIGNCNGRVKELNSALINLEIEREIGQIDEGSYQTAIERVKIGLQRINSEKNDFEALKSKLANMQLGETPTEIEEKAADEEKIDEQTETPQPTPDIESLDTSLPEPPENSGENPVVVYVKNVGKQGP